MVLSFTDPSALVICAQNRYGCSSLLFTAAFSSSKS